MLRVYLVSTSGRWTISHVSHVLLMYERLNVETQGRTNATDIFVIELLKYCCLSGIVQSA
jgi:hypothetical protein